MGGFVKSAGGLVGLSEGPQAPGVLSGSNSLDTLNAGNDIYSQGQFANSLQNYANGTETSDQALNDAISGAKGSSGAGQWAMQDALATGSLTGSKYATDQVQNNPILGQLFGKGGELGKQTGILDNLQNQGFELKPEDMTLYGQTSGNIARMFGQQGNQISQDLASRGLASAPSGAAGAMFSGLAGSQNEQLAQAQQQIMQERFKNTLSQIGQQQNFVSQLGQQGANAVNQQYNRQLQGAQNRAGNLSTGAGLQTQNNSATNQANMSAANFNVDNASQNLIDQMSPAGVAKASSSLFGAASKSPATKEAVS